MEQSLLLLPPRRKPDTNKVQIGKSCILHTNLYEACLKESPLLEQYVIDTQPAIDDEGISLIRRLLSTKQAQLQKELRLVTFKGKMLWGTKKAEKPLAFVVPKNEALNILSDYQVVIKHTRSIEYDEISTLPLKERRQILQVYTVALKQKIYQMGMRETTRNRFLRNEQGIDINGYKILMCYDLKLLSVKSRLNLLVDVGFRLFSNLNALEELSNFRSKEEKQAFAVGRPVVTLYNNRTYKVEKVRFDMNPFSTFYQDKVQKQVHFADYFKEYHKIAIVSKNQPLFETTISYQNQLVNGKQERVEKKGWLIPELCRFSALLSDIKMKDFDTFSNISKQIKIDPQTRKNEETKLIAKMNNVPGVLYVNERCTEVCGTVYDDVEVHTRNRNYAEKGIIKIKEIKEPMKLVNEDWLFVSSNTQGDPRQKFSDDEQFANQAVDTLQDAGGFYGISVKDPLMIFVKQRGVQSWIQRIGKELEGNAKLREKLKIIVLMFAPNEKSYYSELKKFITNTLRLPCQAVLKKTMASKNKITICGKILLQINAKIGFPLWIVPLKHPYWSKKTIMYGGLSIRKNLKQTKWKGINPQQSKAIDEENKANYAVGFVGTYTANLSNVYANAIMVKEQEDLCKVETFEQLMIDWIKYFFVNQKAMPDVIVLYRQGLTEKQVETQGKAEVQALQKIVTRARAKVPNYNPQIVYILTVKKSSKRVYKPEATQARGKFAPLNMKNPLPGTMVFQPISTNNVFDFHLTAQYVTEGTATMTQYQIAYDASEIPEEAIAQFTLQQCYNYPNWLGGVSVPGCLQSADKLTRLVSEHIHSNIAKEANGVNIQLKPFYL